MAQAGANGQSWDLEADVVIIGSGAAGLPAAIKAADAGASVIVVETNYDIGGHAIISGGNTPLGGGSYGDEPAIRKSAYAHGVPCITTLSAAAACVAGIRALREETLTVRALQEYEQYARASG